MQVPLKLTERTTTLLRAMCHGAIMDDSSGRTYYRLGGHGNVPIRYHWKTLRLLVSAGLAQHVQGSVYEITDKGRAAVPGETPAA